MPARRIATRSRPAPSRRVVLRLSAAVQPGCLRRRLRHAEPHGVLVPPALGRRAGAARRRSSSRRTSWPRSRPCRRRALAARFGLINTMVFTHLPSNVLLILVPLMPNLPLAVVVLLARFSISQMDVPTRQSYTMAGGRPGRALGRGRGDRHRPDDSASAISPLIAAPLVGMAVAGGRAVLPRRRPQDRLRPHPVPAVPLRPDPRGTQGARGPESLRRGSGGLVEERVEQARDVGRAEAGRRVPARARRRSPGSRRGRRRGTRPAEPEAATS